MENRCQQPISLLVILLFAVSCVVEKTETEPPTARRLSDQRPLVKINGEILTQADFERYLLMTQGDLAEALEASVRKALFRSFVIQRILYHKASNSDIEVSSRKVTEYLEGRTKEDSEIAQELVEQARIFLMVQKFVQTEVLSGLDINLYEMQNYYEEHYSDFRIGDQARVLEIRVERREEADRIRRQIKKGDSRTFRELAQLHSEGVTAGSGGELPILQRGQLPREFEEVIFQLKPGDVSPIFRSNQGFHIFMLEEWIRRHDQKFHEVQEQIFRILMNEKERAVVDSVVDSALEASSIKVYDPHYSMP